MKSTGQERLMQKIVPILKNTIGHFFPTFIIKNSSLFDADYYSYLYNIPLKKAAHHYLSTGYTLGYDPSVAFSTSSYYSANPDVQGCNPLLHYETHGKYEHRQLKLSYLPYENDSLIDVTPIVYKNNKIKDAKKVAIFAANAEDGSIPDYVIYYISKIDLIVDSVMLIGDYELCSLNELNKVTAIVDYAQFKRHNSYDFGSYKIGLEYLRNEGILNNLEELYLINDSCYGPIFDIKEIVSKMHEKSCDFWGLTDSNDMKYRILSFFYCFKQQVIRDPFFIHFFDRVQREMSFIQLERELTVYLCSKYKSGVYISNYIANDPAVYAGNQNLIVRPLEAIEKGMPLIKVKCLDGCMGKNLHDNPEDIIPMIRKHNTELANIIKWDIKRRKVAADFVNTINIYDDFSRYSVVSFDIFDTLLIRPFKTPEDIFLYIENKFNLPGFAHERIAAEKRARIAVQYKKDITIEDIYQYILPKYSELMDKEMEIELSLCKPNPRILKLFKQAVAENKHIICISDMYLPAKFLKKLLQNCGFTKISNIYVSSGTSMTKENGKLYKYVTKELSVDPENLIHIGDNDISDIAQAKNMSIHTIKIEKLIDSFLQGPANEKFKTISKSQNCLSVSAHLMSLAKRYAIVAGNTSFFKELGFTIGGPLVISYMTFVCDEALRNNIDHLMFVARDGYILHKIYNLLFYQKYKIPYSYVYLNRATVLSSTLDYQNDSRYLKYILTIAKKEIPEIIITENEKSNFEQFTEYKDKIKSWAEKNKKRLTHHLESKLHDEKHVATVDMITGLFTSLRGASEVLGDKLKMGFFAGVVNDNESHIYETFSKRKCTADDVNAINLSEIMLSSPEPGILGIDENGNPIYEQLSEESNHSTQYKEIEQGILEYCIEFSNIWSNDHNALMTYEEWIEFANTYLEHLTEIDRVELNKCYHTMHPVKLQNDKERTVFK